MGIAGEAVELSDDPLAPSNRQSWKAFCSSGRSERLPLSISTNSFTRAGGLPTLLARADEVIERCPISPNALAGEN
jgi:hypothetical protein